MSLFAATFADVPPGGSFEKSLLLVGLAAVSLPFLFGALILTVAHVHRKRSQRPENRP